MSSLGEVGENFAGVYSRDTLKYILNKPKIVVCNTDTSDQSGKHWVLFLFNGSVVEFFDSLGNDPSYYGEEFINFMTQFATMCAYNSVRMQPKGTSICGHYCVAYAYLRFNGYDMFTTFTLLGKPDEVPKFIDKLLKLSKPASNLSVGGSVQCCVKM